VSFSVKKKVKYRRWKKVQAKKEEFIKSRHVVMVLGKPKFI